MLTYIRCPHCGNQIAFDDEYEGQFKRGCRCGRIVKVCFSRRRLVRPVQDEEEIQEFDVALQEEMQEDL